MSSENPKPVSELTVDRDNLYREETFTDLKIGTIQRLVPVKPDGSFDESRETLYSGQTTLVSQAGPVPVHFAIEAKSLQEAIEKFPGAVNEAVERLLEEAREIQREEASRIVVPGQPLSGKILRGGGDG